MIARRWRTAVAAFLVGWCTTGGAAAQGNPRPRPPPRKVTPRAPRKPTEAEKRRQREKEERERREREEREKREAEERERERVLDERNALFMDARAAFRRARAAYEQTRDEVKQAENEAQRAKEEDSRGILALPNVFVAPESGVGVGGFGMYFVHFGDPDLVRPSQFALGATITSKRQIVLDADVTAWLDENRYSVAVGAGYILFPQPFFGLGNQTNVEDAELYTPRSVNADATVLFRVLPNTYVGPRYTFDVTDIVDRFPGGLLERTAPVGLGGGRLSGGGPVISYDSRDNLYAPAKGLYAEVDLTYRASGLGSDFTYAQTLVDLRHYLPLGSTVLAMQIRGLFTSGSAPFYALPDIGDSTRLRGVYRGRFRDNNSLQGQVDFRFPIFARWSGAFFAGAGRVFRRAEDLFSFPIHPAAGAGVRYMLVRSEKLAVRVDFAYGEEGFTYYLDLGEAF